ncbi:MAG: YeeE/YedE family protein [Bradyrhizobium sp.]|uniref:YeeE/YedE family protein n=1 Tax=Bradyrhizobium sp. TaxID=376 RepID=UPI0025B80A95|nr:YeeE/YedE family protein [Bradyrhizobium sp.]MBI5261767.1 YeeE/YedE family protein [Bradyrhizobium sp.]
MDGPSTLTILGGVVVGLTFGAVVQRTNFCTMGAISDLVLMGDGRRFRAWCLAIAVAVIGTQALHFGGIIDVDKSIYLTTNLGWVGAIVGGAIFGLGMTLAGGCGGKTLVRLGSGNLKSLVVALVLGVFAYMTLRGLIAVLRVRLEAATNIDLKAHGLTSQNVGELAGAAFGLPSGPARVLAATALALGLLVFCLHNAEFRRSGRDLLAGLLVGLTVVAGWIVTGVLGADEFEPAPLASITFVAPVGESLQYLMTFTGSTLTFGIAVVAGVVAGSFTTALATGTFRVESFVDRGDLIRHLVGSALMGAGGVMALGCTVGQGITGVSALAFGSLTAWVSILGGGYLGIKLLEQESLGGAIRAIFARS